MHASYVQRMARYNRWQNENLYGVADRLSEQDRLADRGAFFRSIHGTLSHLLWADGMWMARFESQPRVPGSIAESAAMFPDWAELKANRAAMDTRLVAWADALPPTWLEGDVKWFSGAIQRDVAKPAWIVTAHLFNHQTHHRGQVHAMLTQAGGKPDDTDFWLLPE